MRRKRLPRLGVRTQRLSRGTVRPLPAAADPPAAVRAVALVGDVWALLKRLGRLPVLVIDDLGLSDVTEQESRDLLEAI